MRKGLLISHETGNVVAQIFNLLYRGFSTGEALDLLGAVLNSARSAECNSAIQQITNLRYASVARVPAIRV
jgi:uncharacterized protein YoaH (UPF0181 family)